MREPYANRNHRIFRFLKTVVKLLFPKHTIIGAENIVTITVAKPIKIANANNYRNSRECLKIYLQKAMDNIAK